MFENNRSWLAALQDTIKRLGDSSARHELRVLHAAARRVRPVDGSECEGRTAGWPRLRLARWTVDEARFRELPETTLKEWFTSGDSVSSMLTAVNV